MVDLIVGLNACGLVAIMGFRELRAPSGCTTVYPAFNGACRRGADAGRTGTGFDDEYSCAIAIDCWQRAKCYRRDTYPDYWALALGPNGSAGSRNARSDAAFRCDVEELLRQPGALSGAYC